MIINLPATDAAGINAALVRARHDVGVASSMVFTLLVIADLKSYDTVFNACMDAGREHPSRIIVITNGDSPTSKVDAELHMGEEVPGEIISLRFNGEVMDHRDSLVLALLLPDSPVIAWWPKSSPLRPGDDPIGQLATRRITDAMGSSRPLAALEARARNYSPGDTDLTWTRLTPWRALLAAAVDQYPARITGARVASAPHNAAGMLLAAWLEDRLGVTVGRGEAVSGLGITEVVLTTDRGDISISRTDGRMATFSAPGLPRRIVALRRRDVNTLITEELRRMDVDDIFASTMVTLVGRCERDQTARAEAALRAAP